MRYDSLPNSEKYSCESQRGLSNPCSLLSLVLLLLPASKTCLNNLVYHSITSWSRSGYHISFERGDAGLFENTKKILFFIELIQFKPGTKNLISAYLLGVPESTNILLHFSLSLCNLLEQISLQYGKLKGTSVAFIWGMKGWFSPIGCRENSRGALYLSFPSYITISKSRCTN